MKFLSFLFLLTSSAHAGFYFEPYVGLSSGVGESQYNSVDYAHEYAGRLFGTRIGWVFRSGIFYSLDYSFNQFILDSKFSGAVAEDDISKDQLGFLIGKSLKSFKFWGTYFFHNKMQGQDNNSGESQYISSQDNFEGVSGLGLGMSIFISQRTQLCLEYRKFLYEKAKSSDPIINNFKSTSLSEYVLSLSFPLGR